MNYTLICNSCGSSAEISHDLDEFKFEISHCAFCGDDDIDVDLKEDFVVND